MCANPAAHRARTNRANDRAYRIERSRLHLTVCGGDAIAHQREVKRCLLDTKKVSRFAKTTLLALPARTGMPENTPAVEVWLRYGEQGSKSDRKAACAEAQAAAGRAFKRHAPYVE